MDKLDWLNIIDRFKDADACQLPEYHLAYLSKVKDSIALLWYGADSFSEFCYPFILSPVAGDQSLLSDEYKSYHDISSVYGYSGPMVNNLTDDFLLRVWNEFDKWSAEQNIIAEFIRFSPYAFNHKLAHPLSKIEKNRKIAITYLPEKSEILFENLGSKTRNMIRKAERNGLEARELKVEKWLERFQELYMSTMNRNKAESFFIYDQEYYKQLLKLKTGSLRLFGVFEGSFLVSAAMIIVYKDFALYHLGATDYNFSSLGAGNLTLWTASVALINSGIHYFNLGGGRSTNEQDGLLKFKLSNATNEEKFYIGKRIINPEKYKAIQEEWESVYPQVADPSKLLFYR